MNINKLYRQFWESHAIELIVFTATFLPYLLMSRPLPSPDASPYDNIWASRFTYGVSQSLSPFTIYEPYFRHLQDPYLRYVPQAAILRLIDISVSTDVGTAIAVNAGYTMIVEGLLTPIALYWVMIRLISRNAAVASIGTLAIVQFGFASWMPTIPTAIPAGSWGPAMMTGEMFSRQIFGPAFYLSQHWQYAWAMPFALLAIGYAGIASQTKIPSPAYLSGAFIGICLSIQLIQGAIVALVVTFIYIHKRTWWPFENTVKMAIVVALPNLLVFYRFYWKWMDQATSRIQWQYLVLITGITITGVGIAAYIIRTQDISRKPGRPAVIQIFFATALILSAVWLIVQAPWFRILTAYLLKYAFSGMMGVSIAYIIRHRFPINSESIKHLT